jgi:hypothetical protein
LLKITFFVVVLAEDAIKSAINDYKRKRAAADAATTDAAPAPAAAAAASA